MVKTCGITLKSTTVHRRLQKWFKWMHYKYVRKCVLWWTQMSIINFKAEKLELIGIWLRRHKRISKWTAAIYKGGNGIINQITVFEAIWDYKKSKIETSSADRLSENTHTHLVDNKKLKRNHRQVLITSLHSMSPYAKEIEIYDFISFLLIMILWLKPVVNYKAKTKWSSKGGVSQKSKETKYQMEPESEFKARAHFSTNNLVSYKIDHAIDLQIF